MHLFDLQQFGFRFGIDTTVSDFHEAVSEASKAATNDLASRLRFRSFAEYAPRRDFFFIRRMFDDGVGAYNLKLLMSRGLIRPGTVSAVIGTTVHGLRNGGHANLFDPSGNGDNPTVLDLEGGVLHVSGTNLQGQYVMLAYEGGLSVASDGMFEDVPDWLSEAAMTQAALYLAKNRQFVQEGGEDLSELQWAMQRAFSQHARYHPSAATPMASEDI